MSKYKKLDKVEYLWASRHHEVGVIHKIPKKIPLMEQRYLITLYLPTIKSFNSTSHIKESNIIRKIDSFEGYE